MLTMFTGINITANVQSNIGTLDKCMVQQIYYMVPWAVGGIDVGSITVTPWNIAKA